MIGEYSLHGRKHLLPMTKYNEFYKYHDITKVSDTDSFSRFPHGETAYKLWKLKMFPDKSIYELPLKEQRLLMEGIKGHEHARFNLKSLFTDAKDGMMKLPSKKELYWYLKNKIKYNGKKITEKPWIVTGKRLFKLNLACS